MAATDPLYMEPSSDGWVSGTEEVSGSVSTSPSSFFRCTVGIQPTSTGGSLLRQDSTSSLSTSGTVLRSQGLLRRADGFSDFAGASCSVSEASTLDVGSGGRLSIRSE